MHKVIIVLFIILSCIACNNKEYEENTNKAKPLNTSYLNAGNAFEIENEINEFALNNTAVYEAITIKSNNRILLAIKIKQMKLLQKKKIEKEIKQKLSKNFAPYVINVSTDKKIFWEIEKLLKNKNHSNYDEKFNDLIKLSKEKT
jgi:tRNA(Ile2) C34 agmatinyltransferase TiaS